MRMRREYEIERVTSKEENRAIANCYLDVEKQKLVATDDHCMAVVPVTDLDQSPGPCPQDESGFVHPDVIRQARKLTSKAFGGDVIVSANSMHTFIGGATIPRPVAELAYPAYEQVIPSYRDGHEGTMTIGLDAKLLLELAKAIGKGKDVIYLTFPVPELDEEETAEHYRARLAEHNQQGAYVVEGVGGALGILMPVRK
jgi:hypothetical protein